MSEECSHNCSECGSDCTERTAPQSLLEPLNELSYVKKVIGIVSGKGGVGKSMVTSLLASAMQKKGYACAFHLVSFRPCISWLKTFARRMKRF